MKKFISVLLVLTMLFCVSANAACVGRSNELGVSLAEVLLSSRCGPCGLTQILRVLIGADAAQKPDDGPAPEPVCESDAPDNLPSAPAENEKDNGDVQQTPPAADPHENENQAPARPSSDNVSLSDYEAEVVRLVNAERAKAGLSPVSVDSRVQCAARIRAAEQPTIFSHTRPNGTSCFTALDECGAAYRGAGENIAMGQRTPEAVMESFMNSSGHRANILSPSFTKIGVGCVSDGSGRLYWAQMFTY